MTAKAKNGPETSYVKATSAYFDEQLLSHIRCSRNDEAKSMITRDTTSVSDGSGTLLHYAATYGNATITRHLIELGCEIDVPGRDGKTPLMLAVSSGRTAAIEVLLDADTDINITDDGGQSELRAALNRDNVTNEIVKQFLRKLQTTTRTTTELAQRLIAAGGNMYHATTLVDVELLECLLGLGVDVNSRGANRATALHVAAESNHHRVANWLIEQGADVNALDKRGNSALHLCAKNGSKDVMTTLLEHGADFNLTGRRDGHTAADVAVKNVNSGERFAECRELFRELGAVTTIVKFNFHELRSKIELGHDFKKFQVSRNSLEEFDHGGTLLHHAARCNNLNAAKMLIELGSRVDLFIAGRTPLMLAAQSLNPNNVAIVEVLLRANASIELANDKGESALATALDLDVHNTVVRAFVRHLLADNRYTSDEIAGILIDAGANMYHVVRLKDVELMERMLERRIDVDSRCRCGRTGLHEAAKWNDVIAAEWLVEHGADVHANNDYGESALFAAAAGRSKDTLKILLERGADPNSKCRQGLTPLFALYRGDDSKSDYECLELLLRYGAIPQNPTNVRLYGTLFERAMDRSTDEGIRVLVSHLAMLETRGVSITESIMRDDNASNPSKMSELRAFHVTCLRVLEMAVFKKFSLSDLLNGSESELETMARNEEFVAEVRRVCELGELNSYYCKRAMQRIDGASRVVLLKNEAIQVICKLFDRNYDECYIYKVIDFLDVTDVEMLVVMAKTFLR